MTTNKEANTNIVAATSTKDSQSRASCPAECCMCGDYGVSNELFQCGVCQFRSQHRYCSNLYPKAESYQVCNWCLRQRDEKDKSQNSSNSTSSNKINGQEEDDSKNVKNKKKNNDASNNNNGVLLMKSQRSINLKLEHLNNKPIKKQRLPERSPPPPPPPPKPTPTTRKRIITNGALEEKKLIKRKKSEEISNNNNNNNINKNNKTVTTIRRPFFRNKVRRYKLLDEVSS